MRTSEFLKKWPFLVSHSTRESILGRPLEFGNFCYAVERIMGKLQKRNGQWEGEEALPAFRSSHHPMSLKCHQKSGQEAAVYEGGVICEYVAYWFVCVPCILYNLYGLVIFIAFAVNEKK